MQSQERMTDKALFSYKESAVYIGLSERWLRKAVHAGLLKPAKLGSRRLFRRTALDALIERAEKEGVTLDALAEVEPVEPEPVAPRRRRRTRKAVAA